MASRWFSPGTPVFSTNKTGRQDITEILLKVALNAITIFICLFVIVCGLFEWKRICAGILSFVYICILVGDSVIKRRVFAIQ